MGKKLTRPQLDELVRELFSAWREDASRPENPFGSRERTTVDDVVGRLAELGLVHSAHRVTRGRPRYRLVHEFYVSPVLWVESGGYEIVFADLRFTRAVKELLESHSQFSGTRLVRDVESR